MFIFKAAFRVIVIPTKELVAFNHHEVHVDTLLFNYLQRVASSVIE